MKVIESEYKLGEVTPNIAQMLKNNVERYDLKTVFRHKLNGSYSDVNWEQFFNDITNIAANIRKLGFSKGDKVVIYSKNRYEMLVLELALMASGGVAVPVFFNYNKNTVEALVKHSGAKYIAVGDESQLSRIDPGLPVEHIFIFDKINRRYPDGVSHFSKLMYSNGTSDFELNYDADPNDIVLNMYTSGTMGKQKCVQLTHRNILSQQTAIKQLLGVNENDRFLSYLRWHHSFGGIFEKYSALYNGAELSLESSHGLDPKIIMENWMQIKPTVFFSVPIVYHMLMDIISENKKLEKEFFHPGLKFVFTAAAPLPKHISDEFEKRNIPIIEGWGLTETSPCCTLTDPKLKRVPGVIGKPIPGVSIRIADDGELQIKGPNVMVEYYNNPEANKNIFTEDGWYCTGDIGELTEQGLKLITRKDRIFKLANAEKVVPTEIEGQIVGKCNYITHALVEGNGKNYPVALLFPDRNILRESMNGNAVKIDGCMCPHSLEDLSSCLKNCLRDVNCGLKQKFARIKVAMLVDDELKVDNMTLTPSMKLAPNNVKTVYKAYIENMYGAGEKMEQDVYLIFLDEEKNPN
jgi:long-subunit acyl-CoA synthetase (AMP-forming)